MKSIDFTSQHSIVLNQGVSGRYWTQIVNAKGNIVWELERTSDSWEEATEVAKNRLDSLAAAMVEE